jgi:Holliday junction resolvase RusA-like endonuclease
MPTVTHTILPISAPRQVKSDKWNPSQHVLNYRAFRDEVALRRIHVPTRGAAIVFVLPMPESWSQKKRDAMRGKPHESKPDLDNLLKALIDAVYRNQCDGKVSNYAGLDKIWGDVGQIIITTP